MLRMRTIYMHVHKKVGPAVDSMITSKGLLKHEISLIRRLLKTPNLISSNPAAFTMSQKSEIAPLICHFGAYLAIILYQTRRQVQIYSKTLSKHRACILIHIGTGITELARYHLIKPRLGHDIILPEPIDVLSCFLWGWSSLVLVKTLRRGNPQTTRPPYQAGAFLRPIISIASYLLQLPELHRVSISALNSFPYARHGIFSFAYTPYLHG